MGDTKNYENCKEEVIYIKNKILKFLGTIITIICFLFIAKMVLSIETDWGSIDSKSKAGGVIILSAALGTFCLFLVAYCWSLLVKFIEPKEVENIKLISIYIKSNIAKYLPGNVMNLVGRNVLAGQLGFKQISIATSTLIEIAIFGCTTMMLAILFSITKLNDMYELMQKYINYKFILIIIIIGIIIFISIILHEVRTKNQYIKHIKKYFNYEFLKLICKLVSLYSVYFIFSGVVLVIILVIILNINIESRDYIQIVGLYIIAYFIGYITPGSPGGMGVREAVLILLLTNIVESDLAVLASIIHRVITICADIFIYGINYFYIRNN